MMMLTKYICTACRTLDSAMETAERIKVEIGQVGQLVPMQIDLGNLESVQSFTKEFQKKFNKLDVLVNNAGMGFGSRERKETAFVLPFRRFLCHADGKPRLI
jgi:NADP-dependent 3-hydroxy acid dehydrogenase YdfG